MILLFDSNVDRANLALDSGLEILRWRDGGWRNSEEEEVRLTAHDCWFLVHSSDWSAFSKNLEEEMAGALRDLPVIRFTGGDPSGKPQNEHWVRYRLISAGAPFRKEELEAMDRWVKRGCKLLETPWICAEDKPLHLLGLLVLLEMARHFLESPVSPRSLQHSQKWNVSTSAWWKARLNKEKDWPKHLREEWCQRKNGGMQALEEFIKWVNEDKGEKDDLYLKSNIDGLCEELRNAI